MQDESGDARSVLLIFISSSEDFLSHLFIEKEEDETNVGCGLDT